VFYWLYCIITEPFRIYLHLAHTEVFVALVKSAPEIERDGSQNIDTALYNSTRQVSRLTKFWMNAALWCTGVAFVIVLLVHLLFPVLCT
jgi:hypothetical protein